MSGTDRPGDFGPLAGRSAFRAPIVGPDVQSSETTFVNFGDLVRMLGEGIADAQASLDRTSAELVAELATTMVNVVPTLTQTVAADGSVSYREGRPQPVSLLALGVTPTFYQFSSATVEAVMDLRIVENVTESSDGKPRFGLQAGTSSIRAERKLNREVKVSSKFTATLVPVPMPVRLDPAFTTVVAPPPPPPPPRPPFPPRPPLPRPDPVPAPVPPPPTKLPEGDQSPGPAPPDPTA